MMCVRRLSVDFLVCVDLCLAVGIKVGVQTVEEKAFKTNKPN